MDKTAWINANYRKYLRREKRRANKARIAYRNVTTEALEVFADQVGIWQRRAKWLMFIVIVVLGVVGAMLLNVAIIAVDLLLMVVLFITAISSELRFIPDPLYLIELDRRESEASDEVAKRMRKKGETIVARKETISESFGSLSETQESIQKVH